MVNKRQHAEFFFEFDKDEPEAEPALTIKEDNPDAAEICPICNNAPCRCPEGYAELARDFEDSDI